MTKVKEKEEHLSLNLNYLYMKQWEYKLTRASFNTESDDKSETSFLDENSKNGWELVSVVSMPMYIPLYYFKRPLQAPEDTTSSNP